MDKKYQILEQNSTGWWLHDTGAQNLTKEQCNKWLNDLIEKGANPNDLKAVLQDDNRYTSSS